MLSAHPLACCLSPGAASLSILSPDILSRAVNPERHTYIFTYPRLLHLVQYTPSMVPASDRMHDTQGVRTMLHKLIDYLDDLVRAVGTERDRHAVPMVRCYALARDPRDAMSAYYHGSPIASVQERAAIVCAFDFMGWSL